MSSPAVDNKSLVHELQKRGIMLLPYKFFFVATAYITYTDSDEHKTRRLLGSFSENTTLNCRLVASAFGSNPFSCCCHPLLPTPRVCQFTAKL